MSITCWIGAKVDEPGEITLAQEHAGRPGEQPVARACRYDAGHTATLTMNVQLWGDKVSNIKGIDAGEFPLLPEDRWRGAIMMVSGRALKEMINQDGVCHCQRG